MRIVVSVVVAALLLATTAPASALSLACPGGTPDCGPLWQNPRNDPTTMSVLWWTDGPSAGLDVVTYGPTLTLGSAASAAPPVACEVGVPGRCHRVDLTGLIPGAEYWYRVESDGTVLLAENPDLRFRALGSHPLRFAVVGDFGAAGASEACYGSGLCPPQRIAAQIASLRPDLLFTVGDNVYPSGEILSRWDENVLAVYKAALARAPFFLTLGNHDLALDGEGDGPLARWPETLQRRIFAMPTNGDSGGDREEAWYALDAGDVHFVVANSNFGPAGSQDWTDGANQRRWLRADLAATTKPWKFVLFHHTPYACNNHRCVGGDGDGTGCESDDDCPRGQCASGSPGDPRGRAIMRDRFAPILEEFGVTAAFVGHEHLWERTRLVDDYAGSHPDADPTPLPDTDGRGTYYVLTGGGGATLDGAARVDADDQPIATDGSRCRTTPESPPALAAGCPFGVGTAGWCSYSGRYSFAYVSVSATTATIAGVDDAGTVFDEFTISLPTATAPTVTVTTSATPMPASSPSPDATPVSPPRPADRSTTLALQRCARTLGYRGAQYLGRTLRDLAKCTAAARACVHWRPDVPACRLHARQRCAEAMAHLDAVGQAFTARVAASCGAPLVRADLAGARGLAYERLADVCASAFAAPLDDAAAVGTCVTRHHRCLAARLLTAAEPRAHELLRVAGLAATDLNTLGCLTDYGGHGAGVDDRRLGRALHRCQHVLVRQGAITARSLLRASQRCLFATLTCTLDGANVEARCWSRAQSACGALSVDSTRAQERAHEAIEGPCRHLDIETLRSPQGAQASALDEVCARHGIPNLDHLEAITACLFRQHACAVTEALGFELPRADELFVAAGSHQLPDFCPGQAISAERTPLRNHNDTPAPAAPH